MCGLGGLGQYCVSVLKEFKVLVSGIDLTQVKDWVLPDLPNLLEGFTVGDCRQQDVVEQAGIQLSTFLAKVNFSTAKSVVVVTEDEVANLEIGWMVHGHCPSRPNSHPCR